MGGDATVNHRDADAPPGQRRHGIAPYRKGIEHSGIGSRQRRGIEWRVGQVNRRVVKDALDIGVGLKVPEKGRAQPRRDAMGDRHPGGLLDPGATQVGLDQVEIAAGNDDDID